MSKSRFGGFQQKLLNTFLSVDFGGSLIKGFLKAELAELFGVVSFLKTRANANAKKKKSTNKRQREPTAGVFRSPRSSRLLWRVLSRRVEATWRQGDDWAAAFDGFELQSLTELFVWLSADTLRCLGFSRPRLLWNNCCVSELAEKIFFFFFFFLALRLAVLPTASMCPCLSQRRSHAGQLLHQLWLHKLFANSSFPLFMPPVSVLMFSIVMNRIRSVYLRRNKMCDEGLGLFCIWQRVKQSLRMTGEVPSLHWMIGRGRQLAQSACDSAGCLAAFCSSCVQHVSVAPLFIAFASISLLK